MKGRVNTHLPQSVHAPLGSLVTSRSECQGFPRGEGQTSDHQLVGPSLYLQKLQMWRLVSADAEIMEF